MSHVVAGAGAGWMTSFVTCPLDVVKTRMQSQWLNPSSAQNLHPKYRSTIHSLTSIWREEGLRGFYRGLGPTLIGYLPALSVYFPIYHLCKVLLTRPKSPTIKRDISHNTSALRDPLVHMFSAIAAGLACNLSTNPLWVVRTRLMTQHVSGERLYRGTLDAFRQIYRLEGLRGFYKGAAASMVGVGHVAVQFPLYEWLKKIQTGTTPLLIAY